jgi:amino acid transporter
VFGIIFSAIIGLLFLLPFPSWSALVSIVTSASVLMYAAAPLSLGALRLQKPDLPRVYRLPLATVLAPIGFVCATWIIYWSGWQTVTTLMVAMLIGYALMAVSYAFKLNPRAPKMDWDAAIWIIPYFVGILLISYFGTFGKGGIIGGVGVFKHVLPHGGNNDLGLIGGLAASAAWSLIIYFVAMARRLTPARVDHYVRDVYPPPVVTH